MPSQRHKIRKSPKSSPSQNQNTGSLRIRDDIDGDFGIIDEEIVGNLDLMNGDNPVLEKFDVALQNALKNPSQNKNIGDRKSVV